MRNLIVNADDLGWTEGVNRGIAEAHRNGIVTSASLLANGAAFASGVEVTRKTPGLGVGVHLNLSDGEPVAPRELVK
ncbi:MAG: ChbG/HpnK family deacetylase, partial [Candidatus Acidiferrum sp.]